MDSSSGAMLQDLNCSSSHGDPEFSHLASSANTMQNTVLVDGCTHRQLLNGPLILVAM